MLPGVPGDETEGGGSSASDHHDMVEMHAKALIGAVKRGDAKSVADAFRAMKSACEQEGYGDTDDNYG